MGWGKKTAATPQPARVEAVYFNTTEEVERFADGTPVDHPIEKPSGSAPSTDRGWVMAPVGMQYGPIEEPEAPKEKPTDAAKAEMAWAQLRSKKGWVPDTVALLLYEFVKHRGLFEDLTAFAKKRK